VPGVKKVEEFAAWQLADAFKSEVFALLKGSREAIRATRNSSSVNAGPAQN
jgi:hypothetical protein